MALYPPGILDIVILAALALCILLPPLLAPRRFLGILKLLRPLRLLHCAGFAAVGAVMGAALRVGKFYLPACRPRDLPCILYPSGQGQTNLPFECVPSRPSRFSGDGLRVRKPRDG